MSILELKKYPDHVLRERAVPIKEVNAKIKQLARDLIETMRQADGVGLAGLQVGVSQRIFVADAGADPRLFINPEIISKKGKEVAGEGCLSFPGVFLKIKRAREITCRFLDERGEPQEIKTGGALARIIQHETDHLDGVLIIDKVNFLRRRKVLREYKINN